MEGMKRANVVSFLDWRTRVDDYSGVKEKNGEGERIGSGLNLLSACGGESDGVDLKKFRENTCSPIYKEVVSQANGRWGAQIYNKHERIWVEEDAGLKFRGGHLQNRFLSEHSKVETMDVVVPKDQLKITALGAHKAESKNESAGWEKDKSLREPMFEKAVTPSDVGKLNRLVIPKHHAEKYFPLDTTANDKGLLLNFEDNTGKAWRFRYSYWNSSQSYVLTKGWSRFVKEKKLDAGDIVSFERSTDAQNAERLYISWKRRPCHALQIQPGSKASLLRRLSLPSLAASPTFQYGPFQSQALIRTASSSSKPFPELMSVVWQPNNGGAFWRLPTEEVSPLPLSHNMRFLPAVEQNSAREPHDFMQLKPTGDRSSPVENAADMSSKKGVRLFGVNL
ncbi:hypothetical protein SUGI_1185710 [Cryptomeria japonica]|uniref:AP2/ERF and B3 domain-containing transcription factor ARF14 n=1 Tax=Cryptomeria japonica TaxID=3369 RepID=UPI002414822F|nr:AP2/ERF and B3 domain-containing transcription factor ARF14 [Cryptomeria japonica]GLJ55252.1 hypothetical protein SUGI_1185710 [Cryptomeria japonica]